MQVFPPLLGLFRGVWPTLLDRGGAGGGRSPVPGGAQHLCVFKYGADRANMYSGLYSLSAKQGKKIHCKVSGAPSQLPGYFSFFLGERGEAGIKMPPPPATTRRRRWCK